jgi:uncharacterized protein YcbX
VVHSVASATVLELWRYAVKSLLGEQLDMADVEQRGVSSDRRFAVSDSNGKLGSGKTTRRFRLLAGLFDLHARSHGARTLVSLPDGRELLVGDVALDSFLSQRYGDVLHVLEESTIPHHDAAPLHLLTAASLRWLQRQLPASRIDRRRFRPTFSSTCRASSPWKMTGLDAGSPSATRPSGSSSGQSVAS